MTNQEFSNEFDVFYNNIMSNAAPGLNEYEKSVFLTNAQNEMVKAYFNPKGNKYLEGLDDSKKRAIDFSTLMRVTELNSITVKNQFDSRSICYKIPDDLLIFVNEACVDNNYRYVVQQISYAEYDRLMLKPYQYPIKKHIWRLITDTNETESYGRTYYYDKEGEKHILLAITNTTNKRVTFTIKGTDDTINLKDLTAAKNSIKVTETNDEVTIVQTVNNDTIFESYHTLERLLCTALGIDKYVGMLSDIDNSKDKFSTLPPHGWSLNNLKELSYISGNTITVVAEPINSKPIVELIGRVDEDSLRYSVRYLRKPRPIILEDLTDSNISIDGVSTESTCELDSELHQEILQRAVEMAKAAYSGDLNSSIAIGQNSHTNMGSVASSSKDDR
jgi:hypothetical protein